MISTTTSGTSRRRSLGDQRGFSLAETLVALLVGSMTMGTAVVLTSQISRGYTTQLDDTVMQGESRYALQWIEDVLRAAGSNPYEITTSSCPAAGTAFQAVQIDPNGDGVLDDVRVHADVAPSNGLLGGAAGACSEVGEDITIGYDAAARSITMVDNNLGGQPAAMTDDVITQLAFTFLDANRAVTVVPASVVFAQVAVTAESPGANPQLGRTDTVTLTTEVRVRVR